MTLILCVGAGELLPRPRPLPVHHGQAATWATLYISKWVKG